MFRALANALVSITTELYQPVHPLIVLQALGEDSEWEEPLSVSPKFSVQQFATWAERLKLLSPKWGQESIRSQL